MNKDETLKIVRTLYNSKKKCSDLEFELRLKNKNIEAEKFRTRNRKLQNEIFRVTDKAISAWLGNADELIKGIKIMNTKANEKLKKIANNEDIMDNVIKGLSYLDEIVKIAKSI